MKIHRTVNLIKIIFLNLLCILLISCKGKSVKRGMLVATVAPVIAQNHDYISGEYWRYIPEAKIIAFNPDKPEIVKVLTEDFYSACFPDISYDGSHMLFTARQQIEDQWQIWEMDLNNLKSRKITSFNENSTDPAYLPGGRMVFSKLTMNDTVKTGHCLYTCNLDGSDIRQITFSPGASFAASVLRDGRLLTINRQLLSVQGDPVLIVMRPDGTKADMFYKGAEGTELISNACEAADGKIVFIESDKESGLINNVISISYNRPLHTRTILTSGIKGEFNYVLPVTGNKYLISFRKSDSERFSLYEFDPVKKLLGESVFTDPEYDILEVVAVEEYERPKKLPSEVDMEVKTGLLLCQDINFSDPLVQTKYSNVMMASKIEVLGVDTTYGVVDVEEDGSFYLKVMADTPFRIRTMDEKGNVINGPCSWLWLRPNERRGCVGCHEDPELVPENRVSLAVRKSPVIIPVNITGIKEKTVDLE